MKKTMAAALAAACMISAANAQGDQDLISNPRGIVANFDIANIGPILTELGAAWQAQTAPNGQPYVAISAGGGVAMTIVPAACQEASFSGCIGMNAIVLFDGVSFNHQSVTAFNQKYAFSTAGMTEDGTAAYLSRYEIADYGIARGNIASSVLNLVVLAEIFRQEMSTARQTISQEGYAEDMSATLLNGRGLEAIGGSAAQFVATRHQGAMEAAPELIRTLMEDDNAPRNKISNINAER